MLSEKSAQRLRMMREMSGIQPEEIADKVECGISTYRRWESSGIPSLDKLEKLAKIFNVSPSWFLGSEDAGMKIPEHLQPLVVQLINSKDLNNRDKVFRKRPALEIATESDIISFHLKSA